MTTVTPSVGPPAPLQANPLCQSTAFTALRNETHTSPGSHLECLSQCLSHVGGLLDQVIPDGEGLVLRHKGGGSSSSSSSSSSGNSYS
jgi:hypothetical protein